MSQWGKEKRIKNMIFVPHIRTKGFQEGGPGSIIDEVILIHFYGEDDGSREGALEDVRSRYVGSPYRNWEPDKEER